MHPFIQHILTECLLQKCRVRSSRAEGREEMTLSKYGMNKCKITTMVNVASKKYLVL